MGDVQNTVDARNVDVEPRPLSPQMWPAEDEAKGSSWKMREKQINYKHLDDPYSDKETMSAEQITNLLEGKDDQPTLEQARWSLEWPEWEKAIQSELAQL